MSMPRVVGLDHVQIAIPKSSEEVARAFYVGVLGFVEIPKPEDMAARGGAWFVCGVHQLHVGVEDPFSPAKKAHPAFRMATSAHVKALAEALRARGIEARFASDAPGMTRFHVDDPFGNRLEFTASDAVELSLPVLTTERLVLRLPESSEAAAIAHHHAQNESRFQRVNPTSAEQMRDAQYWKGRLQRSIDIFQEGRAVNFFAFLKSAPSVPIASVSLTEITRGPLMSCYLGYGIDGVHEGRGLMSEAVSATLDYAFFELDLHRVQASYMPTNERSGALLRRLGFVVEGYARDYLFLRGAWRDHIITAKLKSASRDVD